MREKNNTSETTQQSQLRDIFYSYTRAQAIRDGVLIEVNEQLRKQIGFTLPIAITPAAWNAVVPVPEHLSKQPEQTERNRLADLLRTLRFNICHRTSPRQLQVEFQISLQQPERFFRRVHLRCVCGPGDDLKPVLTITQLEEH